MPRAYHNLDGFVRDIESAYRSQDAEGQQRWSRFCDIIEWALEHIEGPGDADDAEGSDADAQDELVGDDACVGEDDGPQPGGPTQGGAHRGAPASMLDAVLDGLAGSQRAQAVAELDALRRDAVARTGTGRKVVTGGPLA